VALQADLKKRREVVANCPRIFSTHYKCWRSGEHVHPGTCLLQKMDSSKIFGDECFLNWKNTRALSSLLYIVINTRCKCVKFDLPNMLFLLQNRHFRQPDSPTDSSVKSGHFWIKGGRRESSGWYLDKWHKFFFMPEQCTRALYAVNRMLLTKCSIQSFVMSARVVL